MTVAGNDDADRLVWYVAYGSNMCADRFRCYLAGGSPAGSTSRWYPTCAAGTDILDDRPVRVPHRLFFARRSRNWAGGGVAFLDVRRDADPAGYGRAWLLTLTQFRHLATQENAGCDVHLPAEALHGPPREIRPDGWYRILLPLGRLDGHPMVTLTGRPKPPHPPHPAYLATVRAGLHEAWPALDREEVDAYLRVATAAAGAASPR